MELDDLKMNWKNVNERLASLEKKIDEQEKRSRTEEYYNRRSALERLISQYGRISCVCGLLSVLYLATALLAIIKPDAGDNINAGLSWWVQIYLCVFLFAAFLYDRIIISRLRTINLWEMSVMQVSRIATSCRRLHHRWIIGAIPVVILFLILLYFDVRENEYLVNGMFVGAFAGMIIGSFIYRRIMREYRQLIRRDDIPLDEVPEQ